MRRNRCDKNMQYVRFADNFNVKNANKRAKIWLLFVHLAKRFGEYFQSEKGLPHDEAMIEYFGRRRCK